MCCVVRDRIITDNAYPHAYKHHNSSHLCLLMNFKLLTIVLKTFIWFMKLLSLPRIIVFMRLLLLRPTLNTQNYYDCAIIPNSAQHRVCVSQMAINIWAELHIQLTWKLFESQSINLIIGAGIAVHSSFSLQGGTKASPSQMEIVVVNYSTFNTVNRNSIERTLTLPSQQ